MDGQYVKSIKLKKTYISLHTGEIIKLKHHPYYRALVNNDRKKYRKYVKKCHIQSRKRTAKWQYFLSLKDTIYHKGFDFNEAPLEISKKDGRYVFGHGRHRACILLYLYRHSKVNILFYKYNKGRIIKILPY